MPGFHARPPENAETCDNIKAAVFDIIREGARNWAKLTGWNEPPGD